MPDAVEELHKIGYGIDAFGVTEESTKRDLFDYLEKNHCVGVPLRYLPIYKLDDAELIYESVKSMFSPSPEPSPVFYIPFLRRI